MHRVGVPLTEFTTSRVLCACAAKCAIFESKQLHVLALETGMDSTVYVVYSNCCEINDAEEMPERSPVTWSCMVSGYVQNGLHEEALL